MVYAFWLTLGAFGGCVMGILALYHRMNFAVVLGYFATGAALGLCGAVAWGAFPDEWFQSLSTELFVDRKAAAMDWLLNWSFFGAPVAAILIFIGCLVTRKEKDGKGILQAGSVFNVLTTAIALHYLMKWDAAMIRYDDPAASPGFFELFPRALGRIVQTLFESSHDRTAQLAVIAAFAIGALLIPVFKVLLPLLVRLGKSIFAPFGWLFSLPGRLFRRKKKSGRLMGL